LADTAPRLRCDTTAHQHHVQTDAARTAPPSVQPGSDNRVRGRRRRYTALHSLRSAPGLTKRRAPTLPYLRSVVRSARSRCYLTDRALHNKRKWSPRLAHSSGSGAFHSAPPAPARCASPTPARLQTTTASRLAV